MCVCGVRGEVARGSFCLIKCTLLYLPRCMSLFVIIRKLKKVRVD